MLESFTAPDFVEGVASFVERRDPSFAAARRARRPRAPQAHPAELDRSRPAAQLRRELERDLHEPFRALSAAAAKRTSAPSSSSTGSRPPAGEGTPSTSPSAPRRLPDRDGDVIAGQAPGGAGCRSARSIAARPSATMPYGRERSIETIAPRMSAGCRCVPEMSGRSICQTTRTPRLLARDPCAASRSSRSKITM